MTKFSETIRKARIKCKLGLRELARKIDISPSYLSEIENDMKPAPSNDVIERLADELLLDYNKLLILAETDRLHYNKVRIINKLFADKKLSAEFINELDTIDEKDMKELILQLICSIREYKQDKMRETLWNDDHTK